MPSEPTSRAAEQSASSLADRYGSARRGPKPRWRIWAFGLVAIVFGGTIAYIGYRNLGTAPIEAQRLGFEEKSESAMAITIDVTRDDPSRPGVCIVRARDISGAENGRREIFVPAGSDAAGSMVLTDTIQTIAKPVTADVFGCSYDVPAYLSTPKRPTE